MNANQELTALLGSVTERLCRALKEHLPNLS